MVLLEFSMYPVGEGESLSKKVARSLEVIDKSGVDYQMHAMGTILEGEWDEVLGVVKECFLQMKRDSPRVSASIKIDYREDRKGRIQAKVKAVEKELGREIKK